MTFSDLNLNRFLLDALDEMGFSIPTPIQEKAFSVIMSSRDVVGIAQTGTGKTFAYLLPILRQLTFSTQKYPRILIVVPTRELVVQVINDLESLTPYINVRFAGVYGGTNLNKQKQLVYEGQDILVATPGRLLDLALDGILKLKQIQKLVIDEVDEMMNLGFRPQLITLLDLLPKNRQSILFSATLTKEVDGLLDQFFKSPIKIEIASSGSPLDTIEQQAYPVPNFYTKVNFLVHLLKDKKTFTKVLIFVKNKKQANTLFEELEVLLPGETNVIHSNKTQNYRLRSVKNFEMGFYKVLIATDIIARGLDLTDVSHVINFNIPEEPENYMHRIGRTGRAEQKGTAISFFTEEEADYLGEIELLMNTEIDVYDLPESIEISTNMIAEELPKIEPESTGKKKTVTEPSGAAFHEKKEKNKRVNLGGSYRREIAKKYKKPKTRGQKRK
ncbi:MAG: DEAD/DEAH box helicase [Lutibacter sp.]|uniref:DEAD/DEAH box helicase n=1 Tax=Lutibacter sp. TaxID=1925666 RepID=UPI0017947C0F|nr:DEAD/DEAH box helicase [Lutibacter sp.]MBT8317370.1 DEAD/DEAH box helicase [Lutibacter sp.]NNJ58229.1 DEAD/DEAH box helicase [Lutibacter sp.]